MKTTRFLIFGAVAGIVAALAVASNGNFGDANAQQVIEQPVVLPDQPATDRAEHQAKHRALKASEIIGMNVRGESGDDNIGSINNLMIQHNGQVSYAAVSFGGFLGVGDKLFAVPLEAIEFVKTDDDAYGRINVIEETLKQIKGFDQDNWPEHANKNFLGGDRTLRQAERPLTGTANDVDIER